MIYTQIILGLIILTSYIHGEDNTSGIPIVNVTIHNTPATNISAQAQNISSQETIVRSTLLQQAQQHGTLAYTTAKEQCLLGVSWIKHYNKHIGCGCLLTGYLALIYYLHSTYKSIFQNDSWSSWHKELSLQEFLGYDQQTFQFELIHEIQERYTQQDAPLDFATPLVLFCHSINEELTLLRSYQRTIKILSQLRITKIIPIISIPSVEELEEKINRIIYIKSAYKTAITHYRMQQHGLKEPHTNSP